MLALNSGRHGCVRLSVDGRRAIKVLPKVRHDMTPSTNKTMIANEVRLLRKMQGAAHVVKLVDVDDGPDEVHLVLELCVPVELTACVPSQLIRDVALALSECHARGVVHADVKPANIMYSGEDGVFKLIDFGSSTDLGVVRWTTMAYAAPEVFKQCDPITDRADMWSLGILTKEVMYLTEPDDTLQKVVDACLRREPQSRASAEEIVHILSQ